MPNLPKRKRFQIHLSTAVILMFVAGGIVWANIVGTRVQTLGRASDVFIFGGGEFTNVESLSSFKEEKFDRARNWKGDREIDYGWPRVILKSTTPIIVMYDGLEDEMPLKKTQYQMSWAVLFDVF